MKFTLREQVLILCLALCSPGLTYAEQEVQAEFQLQMPPTLGYGDSGLLKQYYRQSKNIRIDNFTIESKYPTWAENISVDLDFKLSPINPWQFDTTQQFTTTELAARIHVQRVKTEFAETRNQGGAAITLDFKAQCENLSLTLSGEKTNLSGSLKVVNLGHKIALELEQAKGTWGDSSWNISDFKCEGVKGFEKIVTDEIKNALKNPDSLQKEIFKAIVKEIRNLESEINQSIFKRLNLQESAKNFLAAFKPNQLENRKAKQGFFFNGHLSLRYRGIQPIKKEIKTLGIPTNIPLSRNTANGPVLILPLGILKSIADDLFKNGNLNHSWYSDEMASFIEFMKSDRNRKFAWPDLLNYTYKDRFRFELMATQNPSISDIKANGENIHFQLKTQLVVQIYALKKEKYIPYVEWKAPLSANLSLRVYKGKVWLKFLNPTTAQWEATFHPAYLAKYKPTNTKIDTKKIGDAILEHTKKQRRNWKIPSWILGDNLKYRAEHMAPSSSLLWIYWEAF